MPVFWHKTVGHALADMETKKLRRRCRICGGKIRRELHGKHALCDNCANYRQDSIALESSYATAVTVRQRDELLLRDERTKAMEHILYLVGHGMSRRIAVEMAVSELRTGIPISAQKLTWERRKERQSDLGFRTPAQPASPLPTGYSGTPQNGHFSDTALRGEEAKHG